MSSTEIKHKLKVMIKGINITRLLAIAVSNHAEAENRKVLIISISQQPNMMQQ